MNAPQVQRLCVFLAITTALVFTVWQVRPPRAVPDSAAATEFSSGRAMEHVRAIAQRPHPVGSDENARVRDYLAAQLVELGLEVQLHKHPSWNVWKHEEVVLQNIVARRKGTVGDRAVMLLCHYDSVPQGPGAGDDAAGVAAVLESLRALRASPRLQNDLIVLITDAEEGGLLGAVAFVGGHPWLRDVALVLNFEARGNGGPALLMQAGRENGWLIRQFAKASPHPFGSSFAEDVFKRMPNDTDFTIFRDAGKTGLNFAFFKGLRYYHTELDTVTNLDERSVQHHGSNCLALARHFGNLDLSNTREPDRVFFDLFGSWLVHYPVTWVMPIGYAAVAAFLIALVITWWRGELRILGVTGGLVGAMAIAITAAAVTWTLWKILCLLPAMRASTYAGDIVHADLFISGSCLLVLLIFVTVQALLRRWITTANRFVGGLLLWVALTLFASFFVPRGQHLFAWPLLFSSIGLAMLQLHRGESRWIRAFLLSVSCLPGIVLMAPGIYLIAITVGASLSWATAMCASLLLVLFIPALDYIQHGIEPRRDAADGALQCSPATDRRRQP